MTRLFHALLTGILSLTMAACATPGSSREDPARGGEGYFPTRAELAALAPKQEPEPPGGASPRRSVGRWTPVGPAVGYIGATKTDSSTPLEAFVGQHVGLEQTEQMRCVAREFGAFHLAHGVLPGGRVRDFILGRCGATPLTLEVWVTPLGGERSRPAAIMASLVDGDGVFSKILAGGWEDSDQLGVWQGGTPERGVAIVVAGKTVADWASTPSTFTGGEVMLWGKVFDRGSRVVVGYATHGEDGLQACERVPSARFPDFALRCPVAPEDTTVRIEVVSKKDLFAPLGRRLLVQSV